MECLLTEIYKKMKTCDNDCHIAIESVSMSSGVSSDVLYHIYDNDLKGVDLDWAKEMEEEL